MYAAINQLWFGPSIANKSPNIQQSTGSNPIAQAFENLTEKREGWEWDEGDGETHDGGAKNLEGGGGHSGLDVKPTVGVTHPEMCDLIEDLGQPSGEWETVERDGANPLFFPSKELANWAYFRRTEGSKRFQEAARRVVHVRARHEGRESPIGGG